MEGATSNIFNKEKMSRKSSNKLLIKENMKKITSAYQRIRGLAKDEIAEFWDCVVLTTADEDQTKLYQYVIERKVSNGTFPRNVPYFIYADPPGPKIGSGGSILYSLTNLYEEFGDGLYDKRVVIVCVGGQSQRLPTGTFLGKLSLSLPMEQPQQEMDMLDLKMAMYLPFVEKMKAGVFVTCSDDVETYSGLQDKIWSFENDGFTALGHLSSVEIGRQHGVYVLNMEQVDLDDEVIMSKCERVLQKPSLEQMTESGAVLTDGRVCTDSAFYFDHDVSRKLVNYMSDGRRIVSEIDAYKHFLQPLGERTPMLSDDVEMSMENDLFRLLHGTNTHVVLLTKSNFYHLGTMTEFLDNLTLRSDGCDDFFDEMNLTYLSHSHCEAGNVDCVPAPTVMHSVVDSGVVLRANSVIEWCRVAFPTVIGSRCIISHCHILPKGGPIVIPPNCLFHSVAVLLTNDDSVARYVTIAFGIDDNLKTIAGEDEWQTELKYMGVPLARVCEKWKVDGERLFPDGYSLWKAKLFPVCDTMEDSFRCTLAMVHRVLDEKLQEEYKLDLGCRWLSLAEMVKLKSVETMMAYKEKLSRDIQRFVVS